MAGELIPKPGELSVRQSQELSRLIEPLQTEIFLLRVTLAGTTHLEDPSVLEELKEGDLLQLVREENPEDEYAIAVLDPKERFIGYVPRKDNLVLARLMDGGKILKGRVGRTSLEGSFHLVRFNIFLQDF